MKLVWEPTIGLNRKLLRTESESNGMLNALHTSLQLARVKEKSDQKTPSNRVLEHESVRRNLIG